MVKKIIFIVLLPLILLGSNGEDDPTMPLSVEDQIPLLLKILSYDKSQIDRTDPFILGVVYQERYRYSSTTLQDVLDATAEIDSIAQRGFRVVPIILDDDKDLTETLRANSVTVVYVAPLRAYDVEKIAQVTRAEQLVSITGVPSYVGSGLSVSLLSEKGKPVILINTSSSKAEGANFHSQLLKLARVQS